MRPELARLSVESQGDVELARVAGEVDASNVDDLSERLLAAVPNRARVGGSCESSGDGVGRWVTTSAY